LFRGAFGKWVPSKSSRVTLRLHRCLHPPPLTAARRPAARRAPIPGARAKAELPSRRMTCRKAYHMFGSCAGLVYNFIHKKLFHIYTMCQYCLQVGLIMTLQLL
ncbi:unnamed protein product, partial [Laminaria digitata]